ncbi:hypothetical protein AC579_2972 [Pseudocercospora musae]|uniref:Uncharacterized protein n=1 Tax=Pseudocercospora musae TaxID=113226 RepID=A0A139I7R5_9PEZI|nr:hypothetical protein AC579_2972 [Pseudocercospora musae]
MASQERTPPPADTHKEINGTFPSKRQKLDVPTPKKDSSHTNVTTASKSASVEKGPSAAKAAEPSPHKTPVNEDPSLSPTWDLDQFNMGKQSWLSHAISPIE